MKRIVLVVSVISVLSACSHEIPLPPQPTVPGRIVINEVLFNPAGSNAGNQLVELRNVGSEAVELNGWWFCARQDYAQIPALTIGPGQFLIVHIQANGTNSPTDVFLPTMLSLQPISDLNLYRDANFINPASMVHFVQWAGVPAIGRQSEAVSAGLWTAGDFVFDVREGHTINYDGDGTNSNDWLEADPTMGF